MTLSETQTLTWHLCEHCQAPLEERQRYCVVCGARSAGADDPAARYLAAATRHARAVPSAAPVAAPRGNPTAVISVLLAVLPLAAGVGVLVGRGQNDGNQAILDALKAQKAPIVNVGTGGASAGATAATAKGSTAKKGTTAAKKSGRRLSDGAKILATGPAGSARKLAGAKVTKKQLAESRAAVKRINQSKGKAYVESQRNLPDQIVIP
jgi:hypothetical protein